MFQPDTSDTKKEEGPLKVIFLDIDGVLNNTASLMNQTHLLNEKVQLMKILCDLTGAKIVISSAWRTMMEDDKDGLGCPLRHMLYRVGGISTSLVIGRTHTGAGGRGKQIRDWVDQHKPDYWAVIDDEKWDFATDRAIAPRFVRTDMDAGLRWKECKAVIQILGINGSMPAVPDLLKRLDLDPWEDLGDAGHYREDWAQDVANGDTILGYRDWVAARLEQEKL